MSYFTVIELPGLGMADFESVSAALPNDEPVGLNARYAGATDDRLVIVEVWASKADADRWSAEVLGPAIERAGIVSCPIGVRNIGVEADHAFVRPAETVG